MITALCLSLIGRAQEEVPEDSVAEPWEAGGKGSFNFSQVALVNWASGGQNTISGTVRGNLFANYRKDNLMWDNSMEFGYGLMRQGEEGIKKTNDEVELVSKYGRQAFMNNENWFYSTMLSFKTQFTRGYNYPNDSVVVSDFLAPGYILLSIGMDYNPGDNFSVSVSPLTGKVTMVMDEDLSNEGRYGVEPAKKDTGGNIIREGEKVRYEFGGSVKLMYQKEVWENVVLGTTLELFSNYFEKPQNLNVNWEMKLDMKVNKFLGISLKTDAIYDDDIMIEVDRDGDGEVDGHGPRTQLKQVVELGLNYEF
ncbi:MAG: DUF3078 domain-containing protein [Bacteroidales bacterium]